MHLTAYNEGGRVVIDITDDGAGIDVAKVKQKAVEKGLITTERAAVAGEAELLKIIFLPGFSTNAKVDQVSGRGVGLDVVHANVEKMGGIVELFTNLQKGTTFRLILPLTLAIIPSILVETEKHRFALPQASLREIVRIVPGGAYQLSYIKEQCVLRLRGQLLPVVALARAVGLPLSPLSQTATMRVLLLKRGNKSFGLLVDRITDREDILVKPIPSYLKAKTVYSGVTILGDGKIAMVLDPEGIAAAANIAKAQEQLASEAALGQNLTKKKEAGLPTILLFKAAGQETIGVELSKVKRVEEVVPQQMEYISGKPYYNFQGSILRLVRMEEYLPIKTAAEKYTKQYVIILKDGPFPIGFIATKIENTVQTGLKIVHSAFNAQGLADTVLVGDKIILLVSLSNFFARLKAQQRVLETESAKEHG